MDIQKAIEALSCGNSSASKNWRYTPYVNAVLAHIAELQQRAEKAEAQLAEQQSITRRVAAESNALHDERNKLRAQVADLEERLNSCLITVARYSGPDVVPPAPLVVKRPRTNCIGWARDTIREHDTKWSDAVEAAGGSVADE